MLAESMAERRVEERKRRSRLVEDRKSLQVEAVLRELREDGFDGFAALGLGLAASMRNILIFRCNSFLSQRDSHSACRKTFRDNQHSLGGKHVGDTT